MVREALAASAERDAVLRLYVTPGREGGSRPTELAMVSTLPPDLDDRRARGLRMITVELGIEPGVRAGAPWLLGGVKSTSYAVNMAAEAEARHRDADDAVFLANGRIVLEGPVTNVWWRAGRDLFTPGLELGILAGVTRATLLEHAVELDYRVHEGAYPVEELAGAEEAFTSSSVREVMPAIELDGKPIGDGAPGPAAFALQASLRRAAAA
jgi:4-amino-4-deoxychorismate lyase